MIKSNDKLLNYCNIWTTSIIRYCCSFSWKIFWKENITRHCLDIILLKNFSKYYIKQFIKNNSALLSSICFNIKLVLVQIKCIINFFLNVFYKYFLYFSIKILGINKEERGKIGSINQKQEQQKHTMVTKNSLLRPNRTNNLILSSKSKTNTVRPAKTDSNESDIDFSNIPTIKGTYRATKVNISTAYNSTKGTSKLTPDIKDTTRKILSHEQITRSNKTSNFINYSPTDKPTISFTKSTTVMFNEEKLNGKKKDELKTSQELRITTTQSNLDIFKDFHNPDLET